MPGVAQDWTGRRNVSAFLFRAQNRSWVLVQSKLSGLLKASDYSQLDLTGKDLKGILADVGIYRRRP